MIPRLLTIAALSCILAAGCSSRPEPMQKTLRVDSAVPGTEYTLSGSVDADGTKTELSDGKTPYLFTAKAVALNASITSKDPGAHLKASYLNEGDRELTHQATGSDGAQVLLRSDVDERHVGVTIQVVPIGAAPAATP